MIKRMGYRGADESVFHSLTKEALLAFSLVIFTVHPSQRTWRFFWSSSAHACIYMLHVLEASPVYASIEITRDNVVARQRKGTYSPPLVSTSSAI